MVPHSGELMRWNAIFHKWEKNDLVIFVDYVENMVILSENSTDANISMCDALYYQS